jgi:parallel beta-helix repeat protein
MAMRTRLFATILFPLFAILACAPLARGVDQPEPFTLNARTHRPTNAILDLSGVTLTLVPSQIPTLDWTKIATGKPTTIAGYGITDLNSLGDARWPQLTGSYANPSWIASLPFSKLTATPSTISGYGITDNTFANLLGKPTTISGYGITDNTFANLLSKPSTISGYGITDNTFANLLSKPSTIAGYGITDLNSLGDARWPQLGGNYANPSWIASLPFSKLTATPSTIGGYGITDLNSLGDARWPQLSGANTFTGANVFTPLQSFNSIASRSVITSQLANPATPTATPIGAHGVSTWSYKIVAKLSDGTPTAASAAGSTTIGDDVLDSTNKVSVTWAAVTGAASYDVYRTAVGVSPTTTGKIANVTTNSYVDAGAAGDSSNPPIENLTGSATAFIRDSGGQVFDAKAYGAKGDGVTNDAPAIAAAIAAAPAGGRVALTQGSYYIATGITVSKPLTIQGAGRDYGGTTIKVGPGISGITISSNVNSVTIENLRIECYTQSRSAGTAGIKAIASDLAHSIGYLHVRNVELVWFETGIDDRFCQMGIFENVRSAFNKYGLYQKRSVNMILQGGDYSNNTTWGVFLDGDSGFVGQSAGTRFSDTNVTNNGSASGGNVNIQYNDQFSLKGVMLDVPASGSTVNASIYNSTGGTIAAGSYIGSSTGGPAVIVANSSNTSITNCKIVGNVYGVRLISSSHCDVSHNEITLSAGFDVWVNSENGAAVGGGWNTVASNHLTSTGNATSIYEDDGVAVNNTIAVDNIVAGAITLAHADYSTNNRNLSGALIGGAWIDYTPTVTTTSGSITTFAYRFGRYRRYGNRIDFEIDFAITTNGSGAGQLVATLPTAATAHRFTAHGLEYNTTGKAVWGLIDSVTSYASVRMNGADAVYPGGDGRGITICGSYEAP